MQCSCKLLIAQQSIPGEVVKAIKDARFKKTQKEAEAEKWVVCLRVRSSWGRNQNWNVNNCPHAYTMSSLPTEQSWHSIQHVSQSMTGYSKKMKGSIFPFCRNIRGSRAEEMAQ